jgi:hypothetical protein
MNRAPCTCLFWSKSYPKFGWICGIPADNYAFESHEYLSARSTLASHTSPSLLSSIYPPPAPVSQLHPRIPRCHTPCPRRRDHTRCHRCCCRCHRSWPRNLGCYVQTSILDRDGDGLVLAPILGPPLKDMILDQDVRCVCD